MGCSCVGSNTHGPGRKGSWITAVAREALLALVKEVNGGGGGGEKESAERIRW